MNPKNKHEKRLAFRKHTVSRHDGSVYFYNLYFSRDRGYIRGFANPSVLQGRPQQARQQNHTDGEAFYHGLKV